MLIVSLKTLDFETINFAQSTGSGIELRLDALENFSLFHIAKIRRHIFKPVIFTLRRLSQGGCFQKDYGAWIEMIKSLCAIEPDFFDIDSSILPEHFQEIKEKFPNIQWIISYHGKNGDLEGIFNSFPPADIYKIVQEASSSLDALKMLLFVKKKNAEGEKIIGLCTGVHGQLTRILSPIFGNVLSYAPLEQESGTASGQISLNVLTEIYRYYRLNPLTKIFALIGNPIDKSPSHITHNKAFELLDKDAIYVKISLEEHELSPFFGLNFPFKGLSITSPFKEKALAFVDTIDDFAQRAGSINTIKYEKGKRHGFNTDGLGALKALENLPSISHKKVLVVGAGGAARAIALLSKEKKAHVTLTNRTLEKGKKVAAELGVEFIELEAIAQTNYDILIHCTPSSMPIPSSALLENSIVLDINHSEELSAFLQEAARKNCRVITGITMFATQADEQFKLWFGKGVNNPISSYLEPVEALDEMGFLPL